MNEDNAARGSSRAQRDEGAVRPAELRALDLPSQHRQLVSEREDLGVLLDVVHSMDADELTEATGEEIDEREDHDLPAWSVSKARSRPVNE
ncbi:MAG: hypothetical protein ACYDGN_09185 [Acidimicrobiales bacterium]